MAHFYEGYPLLTNLDNSMEGPSQEAEDDSFVILDLTYSGPHGPGERMLEEAAVATAADTADEKQQAQLALRKEEVQPPPPDDCHEELLSPLVAAATTTEAERDLDVCNVCYTTSLIHDHYGGRVCESCRAFFRRAVQNGKHGSFKCKQSQSCQINSKSRRSCTWCRYQRCLRAGMRGSWVMPSSKASASKRRRPGGDEDKDEGSAGQQPQTPPLKKYKRKSPGEKKPPAQKLAFQLPASPLRPELAMEKLTIEEMMKLQKCFAYMTKHVLESEYRLLTGDLQLAQHIMESIHMGRPIQPHFFRLLEKWGNQLIHQIALGLDDMRGIDPEDRRTLVKHNFPPLFVTLLTAYFHEGDFESHKSRFMSILSQKKSTSMLELVNCCEAQAERASGPHHSRYKARFTYDLIFMSPWAPSWELEQKHRDLMRKIQDFPRMEADAKCDKILSPLALLNILFSPHCLNLRDRPAVERVHNAYAMMLYRYLKTMYKKNSNSKFHSGLMLASLAREASEIHRMMLPV